MNNSDLKTAIRQLTIPILWTRLGLPGSVRPNCCIRSPLRDDDRHPSFSIYANGTRWKDHGTGDGGDSFDLYKAATKTSGASAVRAFIDLTNH
jgi:hypothetical protein